MTRKFKLYFNRFTAITLIAVLAMPHVVFASEFHGSLRSNEPTLTPFSVDLSLVPDYPFMEPEDPPLDMSFSLPINELTELSPELLEGIMRSTDICWSQDFFTQGRDEITGIFREGRKYSSLTENARILLYSQMDIAYGAHEIVGQLFAIMELDGFTLAESIELMIIMSSGLFDYIEARIIFESIPSTFERLSEVARFEQFAQRFDIVAEVNDRRLINRPFMSTNGFDEALEKNFGLVKPIKSP